MWEETQERSVARVENLSVWGVCVREKEILNARGIQTLKAIYL